MVKLRFIQVPIRQKRNEWKSHQCIRQAKGDIFTAQAQGITSWHQAKSFDHLSLNFWQIVRSHPAATTNEEGTQLHLETQFRDCEESRDQI